MNIPTYQVCITMDNCIFQVGRGPPRSRVACAKLLGVHLRHDLNFSQHVEPVVAICNQRLYLLAQPKKQGLDMSLSLIHI